MPFPIIAGIIIRAAAGYAVKTGARIASNIAAKRAAAVAATASAKAAKKLSRDPKKGKLCKECAEKKSASSKKPADKKPDHQAGKSQKKYGHARSEHGSHRPAQQLKDRARSTGNNQGHFSDNRMIEEAFSKAPTAKGSHVVKLSKTSNVYTPSGQTLATNNVRVIIGAKGPKTAYPFIP